MNDTISLVANFVYFTLALGWAAWMYPFLFRAPHGQKRQSVTAKRPTLIGLLLESFAIFLAFVFHLPLGTLPDWPRLAAAAILMPPSIALAWSAVSHLGKQFRVTAGLYSDHELVQSGAYAVIRHPIYGTLFGMMIASMLAVTRVEWMAPLVAMFIVGTEIRVRTEDGLLESRFGEDFRRYRQRVRAYIPFVR